MVKLRPTLPADLEHHEEDIQLVSLRLLRSLVTLNEDMSDISPHVLHFMSSAMRTFPAHPNAECRRIFYEICMYLFDRATRLVSGRACVCVCVCVS